MSSGSAAGRDLQQPSSRRGVSQTADPAASNARIAQAKRPGELEVHHTSGNASTRGTISKTSGKSASSGSVARSESHTRAAPSTGQKVKSLSLRDAHEDDVFQDSRNLKDEYKALRTRFRDLEKSTSVRENELCQALEHAKIRGQSLQSALADAERRLATATNDLASLRSLTVEDVDTHALLTLFDDLNDAVNDAAFRFINDLKLTDDVVRVSPLPKLPETYSGLRSLLASFFDNCANEKLAVEQALVPAVQGVFHWLLLHYFFHLFSSRAEKQLNTMLLDVQSRILATETQEYSARWRSITYNALRGTANDDAYVSHVAETIVLHTRLLVGLFVDTRSDDTSFAKLYEEARKVCAMALRWKDSASGSHLSYDYGVLLPFSCSFNEAEMDSDEIPNASSKNRSRPIVALTISAGLVASRTGDSRPPQVVRKAQVILVTSDKVSNEDRMKE